MNIKEHKEKEYNYLNMWIVRNVKDDWCPRDNQKEERYGGEKVKKKCT